MPQVPDAGLSETVPAPSHLNLPLEIPCLILHLVSLSGQEALPHWVSQQRPAIRRMVAVAA